ncbi:hypothetical protein TRICI_004834 [Trichomonascus ciferrii]|uniref:Uncharacterized protein n=1 Tax=Trichomonascus ciferrii TaxID=44093 RepID=A0A642UZ15_9ASCO|nr:hypothetical protein TRICI_004834 [Trichomonascus ciferrii]
MSFEALQTKFADGAFFSKVTRFFQLLGQRVDPSSKCHAKLLLIAFMLNHHTHGDVPLAQHIQCLGSAFLNVCAEPSCWFKRVRFFYAYSCFYRVFLDSKCKNAATKIPQVLSNMTKSMMICQVLSKNNTSSSVQRTLNYIHAKTRDYMVALTRLVGSSSKAVELVRQDVARSVFLNNLQKRYVASQIDPSDKNRQYRSVGMQLILDPSFTSVHLQSREAKYDCYKHSTCSVMRDCYHMKLDYIKQLIRFNINSNKQSDWLPCFLGHVKMVLATLSHQLDIDDECVQMQCARNCYDPSKLISYLLSHMKTITLPDISGRDYPALISSLETRFSFEGCSKAVLFALLDILDDMRVDHMDHFFHLNISKLSAITRKHELRFFVEDLSSHRMGVKNLLNWVEAAKTPETEAETPQHQVGAALEEGRLRQLKIRFSKMITWFPCPARLDELPETFKYARLTILRTLIMVKDVVSAFTILQFVIMLSGDCTHVCRIKQGIMTILKNECNCPQSEMVTQLYDLVQTERPCMNDRDQKILRSLINRVIRKPDITASEQVPKLALERIQFAIQSILLDEPTPAKLTHFEQEVSVIAQNSLCILNLNFETYQPIYKTLLHFNEIWDRTSQFI